MFIITFSLSIVFFIIAYLQSKEKGFLFSNDYIFASKEERNKMDKKAEYKLSKIVFIVFGIMFFILALEMITDWNWLFFIVIGLGILLAIYSVIQDAKSNHK